VGGRPAPRWRSLGSIDDWTNSKLGLYSLVFTALTVGVLSTASLVIDEPLIYPSLGPTAFLVFWTPLLPTSCPRNALIGHLIGAVAGYLSLLVFGLTDIAPALVGGVDGARVGATAMSIGLTSGVMVWLRVPHPPAAATTLIISLGILRDVGDIALLVLAVGVLVAMAFVTNRLAGLPYPMWGPRPAPVEGS
jgi:CBS-domain-containing membrane protein